MPQLDVRTALKPVLIEREDGTAPRRSSADSICDWTKIFQLLINTCLVLYGVAKSPTNFIFAFSFRLFFVNHLISSAFESCRRLIIPYIVDKKEEFFAYLLAHFYIRLTSTCDPKELIRINADTTFILLYTIGPISHCSSTLCKWHKRTTLSMPAKPQRTA